MRHTLSLLTLAATALIASTGAASAHEEWEWHHHHHHFLYPEEVIVTRPVIYPAPIAAYPAPVIVTPAPVVTYAPIVQAVPVAPVITTYNLVIPIK